ncbi:hypothetical protein [Streptomyces sp. NPDC001678]|uniref:hypothetical protein n=1 Tax=Streptomyces sp. NPDC001678 TaxID=3364599 RepID=UPI0036C8FBE7
MPSVRASALLPPRRGRANPFRLEDVFAVAGGLARVMALPAVLGLLQARLDTLERAAGRRRAWRR